MVKKRTSALTLALCFAASLHAGEEEYYKIITLPTPKEVVLEVGGLAALGEGRVAASTRRGEIWIIENAYADPPKDLQYSLYASGLNEALGLIHWDGALYAMQRSEMTRIRDTNGDRRADEFLTLAKGWGASGHYHEFTYGPKRDLEGNLWFTLNIPTIGEQPKGHENRAWRGWGMKLTPEGEVVPICGGMRSPCGIGMNAQGDMFYTDQQGYWIGTNSLTQFRSGDFGGHPYGLNSCDLPGSPLKNPGTIPTGKPRHVIKKQLPALSLPAVWFPYVKMGQSATDIACDQTDGKFGPFDKQLFVGEHTLSGISRVFLEKVRGEYQGACFPFLKGFQSGVLRLAWGEDGSMFVGQTDRGWSSIGGKPYGLQRVVWTGKTPFEVKTMEARSDGFLLTFTLPVDEAAAGALDSYSMTSYTYNYHADYGSDEIDKKTLTIGAATVADDALSVKLDVGDLREGYVHELHLRGVRSNDGRPLLHDDAYYTLNRIP